MTVGKKVSKQLQNSKVCDQIRSQIPKKVNTYFPKNQNEEVISQEELKDELRKKKKSKIRSQILLIIGLSLIGFLSYDPLVDSIIGYNLQLRPNGLTTEAWKRNPIPLKTCWYIFGILNGPSFLQGSRPHLVEHGPFCYDLYRNRRVLEWNEGSVKFAERFEFKFNPTMSVSRDTQMEMINLPIFAGVMSAKAIMESFYLTFLGPIVYNAITVALTSTGEELIKKITARQLMEGQKLTIIEYLDLMMKPFRSIGLPLPNFKEGFLGIVDHSFGITTSASAFEIGPFDAYTKTESGHVVGQVYQFDGQRFYSAFKPPCNRLGGSDGIFHPRPVEDEQLYIYIHHLCRLLRFDRNSTTMFAGTQSVYYTMDHQMFNAKLPRNRCFCKVDRPWQECDGWGDMSECIMGLPIGISYPHFCGSPRRRREIYGMKPDLEKHLGYVYFEPQLGVPVSANIPVQAILAIQPISSVTALSKIRNVKMPLLWLKIFAGADTPLLTTALFVGSNSIRYGSYGIMFGGIGLSALMLLRTVW